MSRLRFTHACEVYNAFPTLADMIGRAPTAEPAAVFARSLAAGPTPEDAVTFCAHALSRREAVWWACACVRALARDPAAEPDAAFVAAQAWVDAPEEEHRRAALACGQAADRRAAAAWLALAAGWSGGSIAGPDQPPRPASSEMTARAVTVAILTALARVTARERAERLQSCLSLGLRLMGPGAAQTETSLKGSEPMP